MKFYWDPLVQKPESPPSTPADIQGQKLKSKKATPLTYLEHIAQNPPTVGKNHYKGDYVYANFGYVRDEDTMEWFDPESSQPLKDKYISYRREGPIEEVDGKHIPDFKRSERIFPRIMSTEEQEHFYDEYLQYVHDDVDAEGDPRDLRITPATFAQWAVGARKGKAYEEEEFTPDSVIWSKRVVPPKQPKDSRPKRRQFDMVTGEEISELGDSDEEAVLITEAEGVNMMAIPREFSMMLPGVAQDLAHKAFGHRENDPEKYSQGSITSSDHDTASDPTVFNETRAVNHLGTLGDPMSGKAEFAGLSEEMLNLLDEKRLAEKRTVQKQEELAQAREVEIGLAREIFFLNARKNLQPIRVVNRGNPHGMDGAGSFDPSLSEGISNFDGSDEHEEELMSPASLPKQHKQFRRYFKEQIATESMAINRLNIYADVSDMEYERIRKDINVMRGVKDELVRSFGVENMEDIPLHVPHPLYMDRVDFAGGQSTYE
ncbi:uncharacterized protein LY89DRAFT_155756 [Mollisia scopiformis]|uniref:Uncharacterized protein n=1 Tax=Mollisia scopiformis TaxID=149040 RepID=A0A194X088_MOLSC|nr:uncharacterized protein LY89DRAFT_155756 [Mollisia scopiformis]KUJ13287.1 hypothetical protein LY89DRAFT_155756 [Mollisia scopiformis]